MAVEMAMEDPLVASPGQQNMNPSAGPYDALFGGKDSWVKAETGFVTIKSTGHKYGTYKWAAQTSVSRGTMVLCHGYGEHLGRYGHVASYFAKLGFDVCGVDHYCHGRSEGYNFSRGYLPTYNYWVDNWSEYIQQEVAPTPGPHYVYAHSTGCAIVNLALGRGLVDKWDKLKAVTCSAPLTKVAGKTAEGMYKAPGQAKLLTSCCMNCCFCLPPQAGELPHSAICAYDSFVKATQNDPRYFGFFANYSLIRGLLEITLDIQENFRKATWPLLVLISPEDQLVDVTMAKRMYDEAPSTMKGWESDAFKGDCHELHNHENFEKPMKLCTEWLESKGLLEKAK